MAAITLFCLASIALAQYEIREADLKDDCMSKGKISKHQTIFEKGTCWAVLDKDTVLPWENAVDLMMFSYTVRRTSQPDPVELEREKVLLKQSKGGSNYDNDNGNRKDPQRNRQAQSSGQGH